MLLSPRPRRAHLRSFVLTVCLLLGAFLALVPVVLSAPWLPAAIATVLLVALAGLIRPEAFSFPYMIWNRLGSKLGRFTNLAVSAICFHTIVLATGRLGSRLNLTRNPAARSMWTVTQEPAAYFLELAPGETGSRGWVQGYVSWAWRSGNLWLVFLLPFVALLRLTRRNQATLPAGVYTLF